MAKIELNKQLKSAPTGYYVINLKNMMLECFSSIDDVHDKKGSSPLFALSSDNEVFLDGVAANPYFLDDYRLMICTFGLLQFLSKFPVSRNATICYSNSRAGVLVNLADHYVNVLSDSIVGRSFKNSIAGNSMGSAIEIVESGLYGHDLDEQKYLISEVFIIKTITGFVADLLRWKDYSVEDASLSIGDTLHMLRKDNSTPFLLA